MCPGQLRIIKYEDHLQRLLRRKLPKAWGTTTDIVIVEINPFTYAREIKHLTLKDLETYLISDG